MKRVLILSCATGQGHNSAGLAVSDELKDRGVETYMLDPISLRGETPSKFVCDVYNGIAIYAPKLFGTAYKAALMISSKRLKSIVYAANTLYAQALYDFLKYNSFDAIVCSHLYPAEALTYIKKHYDFNIPCYGVATDYCCIPFWEETSLDKYFIPHADLMGDFLKRGVPREKLVPTGIPVRRKILVDETKAAARDRLDIDAGRVILVMSGSMGYGNLISLISKLRAKKPADASIVVLGGNNEDMKTALRADFMTDRYVKIIDFTENVPTYIDASDILLTKPGGLTSTEAAVKRIPLVHTFPIPGCETLNATFFERHGLCVTAPYEDMLVNKAISLLEDEDARSIMRERQAAQINRYAARDISDVILG